MNTIMLIARRVIYTIYNREDEVVKSSIQSYEFIKNIRPILIFRKEGLVFLNHQINLWQMHMLKKAILIIKKLIKGRPTVQCYGQKYREDAIWQNKYNYTDELDVKYITYFHNE